MADLQRYDETPQITREQARTVERMIYRRFLLKDADYLLQVLGLKEPAKDSKIGPDCPKCGFTMRKTDSKPWTCGHCTHQKKKAKRVVERGEA